MKYTTMILPYLILSFDFSMLFFDSVPLIHDFSWGGRKMYYKLEGEGEFIVFLLKIPKEDI